VVVINDDTSNDDSSNNDDDDISTFAYSSLELCFSILMKIREALLEHPYPLESPLRLLATTLLIDIAGHAQGLVVVISKEEAVSILDLINDINLIIITIIIISITVTIIIIITSSSISHISNIQYT